MLQFIPVLNTFFKFIVSNQELEAILKSEEIKFGVGKMEASLFTTPVSFISDPSLLCLYLIDVTHGSE